MVDFVGIRPKDGPPRLVPATQFDLEQLEKVRPGKPALAVVKFKRSLQHLRWYRGLLSIVAEARGMHPDELHAELKWKAGLVKRILLSATGAPFVELHSVAFHGPDAIDEIKFTEFRVIAVNLLFRDYLDSSDQPEVWSRVEELCGPCPW